MLCVPVHGLMTVYYTIYSCTYLARGPPMHTRVRVRTQSRLPSLFCRGAAGARASCPTTHESCEIQAITCHSATTYGRTRTTVRTARPQPTAVYIWAYVRISTDSSIRIYILHDSNFKTKYNCMYITVAWDLCVSDTLHEAVQVPRCDVGDAK